MTPDRRSADRQDLEAMTRDFLSKGGEIVRCPPGGSENVVYKRNSFKRRARPSTEATAAGASDKPAGGA